MPSKAVDLKLVGETDDEGPTVSGLNATGVDPLDTVNLLASEPLPSATTARLVGDMDTIELEPVVVPDGSAVAGFRYANRALRYGTNYQVAVDPWTDFAGNRGRETMKVHTFALPTLYPENGFESNPMAMAAGATIVHSDQLPTNNGERSALVARDHNKVKSLIPNSGGARLSMRLPVAPGDRVVRFTLRPVSRFDGEVSTSGTLIRAAVPGGSVVTATLPDNLRTKTQVVIPGFLQEAVWLGDTQTIEVALPPDVQDEIVLNMRLTDSSGFCAPATVWLAYLIDDVRVE